MSPISLTPKLRQKPLGYSLIEMIVGVAITGMLILFSSQLFTRCSAQSEKLNTLIEIEDLKTILRKGIDCDITYSNIAPSCAEGTFIALYNASNNILIKKPVGSTYSQISGYSIRAKCHDDPNILTIESSKDGTTWSNLFPKIPFVCH